jgi:beta-lactamase regulating signal transducer with metallopeptidase domain
MLLDDLSLGAFVVVVPALVASLMLRSAAARRLVFALALGSALVTPALHRLWKTSTVTTPGPMRALPLLEPQVVGDRAAAVAAQVTPAPVDTVLATGIGFDEVAISIWAVGVMLVALRLGQGLARTHAMARRALPVDGWDLTLADARRAIGCDAQVLESAEVDVPVVAGLVWPVILVPLEARGWTERRRRFALLHQLANIRQHNSLVAVVAGLACAVHWFNPVVWLMAREVRYECEAAADEAVIRTGESASAYAAELVTDGRTGQALSVGALATTDVNLLARRLMAVRGADQPR